MWPLGAVDLWAWILFPSMLSQVSNKGITVPRRRQAGFICRSRRPRAAVPAAYLPQDLLLGCYPYTSEHSRRPEDDREHDPHMPSGGDAVFLAAVPDAAKHKVACFEVFKRGAVTEKIKLLLSLMTPRWIKNLLLRLGLKTPYPMTLLRI